MLPLIASLIPLMIAGAILPTWISLVSLLLDSPNGTTKALAFNGGVTGIRLLQLLGAGEFLPEMHGIGLRADLPSWATTLLVVAGVALIVLGAVSLGRQTATDAEPPRWFGMLRDAGTVKCALAGALLNLTSPRQWLLAVSAAALIHTARVGTVGEAVAVIAYIAGSQSLTLTPVLLGLKNAGRRETIFDRFADVVTRNSRRIGAIVVLLAGVYLTMRGLT